MNIRSLLSAALVSILTFTACTTGTTADIADSLRQAEIAIARGNIADAQHAGKYLSNPGLTAMMDASQLARLSMVYMQLADSIDQLENLHRATDLYDMALKANADSAAQVYNNLPPDQLQYYATMAELSMRRSSPLSLDSIADEEEAMHLQLDTLM